MGVKALEELLPDDVPLDLDGGKLFRAVVREEESVEGGIAMASGCDACMNGGGGGPRRYGGTYGTKEKAESPYKK